MCTAITYHGKDHYFGRNLDLNYHHQEEVVITPRHYAFSFRKDKIIDQHYALIGMAYVVNDYPLYYDAMNEKGLAMAGLNFPENAFYAKCCQDKNNIAPFELIPWILAKCQNVQEAKQLLKQTNLADISFSEKLKNAPLHWMIADDKETIVVEYVEDGLHIESNEIGVLTNNPPFAIAKYMLNHYMSLSPKQPKNLFSSQLSLYHDCQGMGALGLPGDYSSISRFIKAGFVKMNSPQEKEEKTSVQQFFHILNAVAMPKGSVETENGHDITIYSSCCNLQQGIYYYTTYDNSCIHGVNMFLEDLDRTTLMIFSLIQDDIMIQNKKSQ